MLMTLAELGAILVAAIFGAALIMSALKPSATHRQPTPRQTNTPQSCGAVFLFQNDLLVDATPDAWALISHGSKSLSDYETMLSVLSAEFPSLETALTDPDVSKIRIQSESDALVHLDIQRTKGQLRIALRDERTTGYENAITRISQAAHDTQSSLMQDITVNSPQLIWHEDKTGKLLWANHAYAETLRACGKASVFDAPIDLTNAKEGTAKRRMATTAAEGKDKRWFDITSVMRDDGVLHFANDATAVVRADTARTEFVRTLGKTFAELSIGLAIFDKNRQLAMFNPALLDMTKLPADFLSASPTIDTVLDRLRELRMMPEPKNYATWREQFTAVETAAKDGTYSKNWTLPDGQTYRVTGKPYPDGAFALLFEDISAEVSLARRFRLDIETGQAVLDTLSDAIAVFSSTGTLVMSNSAYAQLWDCNPELMLEHRVLRTEMKIWQDHCIPSAMWNDMRDYVQLLGARKPWTDNALLDDGRHLQCHANPIAGGMTMVRFVIASPARPEIHKLMQPDTAIRAMKR